MCQNDILFFRKSFYLFADCEQINYSWEVFSRETDHFSRQQTNNCSELKDPDDREVVCSLLKDKGQLEYEDQEGQKLAQAFV